MINVKEGCESKKSASGRNEKQRPKRTSQRIKNQRRWKRIEDEREKIRVIDSRETLCFNDFSSWATSVPLSFFTSWGCLLAELETWGTMREKRRRRRSEGRRRATCSVFRDHLYREKNKTASLQNEGCVVVTSSTESVSFVFPGELSHRVHIMSSGKTRRKFSLLSPPLLLLVHLETRFLSLLIPFVCEGLVSIADSFFVASSASSSFSSHSLLFSLLHLDPDRYSRSQFESLYPNLSSPSFSFLAVCCSNPFISCRKAWMMVNRQGGHLSHSLSLSFSFSLPHKSLKIELSTKRWERKITLPTLGSKWRKEPFTATEVAADDFSLRRWTPGLFPFEF